MTEEEILRDYQQAKNKSEQIGILADLNACSWEEIADVLSSKGVVFKDKKKRLANASWSDEKVHRVIDLLEQEYSVKQVAEHLGVTEPSLRSMCYRKGIKIMANTQRQTLPDNVEAPKRNGGNQTFCAASELCILLSFLEDWLGRGSICECSAKGSHVNVVARYGSCQYRVQMEVENDRA